MFAKYELNPVCVCPVYCSQRFTTVQGLICVQLLYYNEPNVSMATSDSESQAFKVNTYFQINVSHFE